MRRGPPILMSVWNGLGVFTVYSEKADTGLNDLLVGEGGMDVYIRTKMIPDDANVKT